MSARSASDEEAVRKRRGERAQQARKEAILQLGRHKATAPPSLLSSSSLRPAVQRARRAGVGIRAGRKDGREEEEKSVAAPAAAAAAATAAVAVEVPTVGTKDMRADAAVGNSNEEGKQGKGVVEVLTPVTVGDNDTVVSGGGGGAHTTARPDAGDSDVESVLLVEENAEVHKRSGGPAHILTHLSQMERSYLAWQPTQHATLLPTAQQSSASPPSAAPAAEPSVPTRPSLSNTASKPPTPVVDTYGGGDATARRVDRILDFLKGVEEDDVKNVKNIQARHGGGDGTAAGSTHAAATTTTAGDAKTGSSAGIAVFDGVKAKIMGQQMEIDEKARTLGVLKSELKRVKESLREQAVEFKKELKSKLALQRKEYETIIKRHLTFIDKLLAEKEELTKKCEALTGEVKALEKQFREKSVVLEEQHERDLKQQKELWAQAEKIKRDKWIQEKTKAIKDQTIKGLEPEIQRMLSQHKLQNRQMEEKYREELAREKNLLIEQQARQAEAMRDRVVAERQRACEEEREFARQRYQKQLERDEMEFQQQRRKLLADFDEQKHALLESHKQQRQADDTTHRNQLATLRAQIDALHTTHDQKLDETRRKHAAELHSLRQQLAIEKEEWCAQYMARVDAEMKGREKAFKEKLVAERDAEIEMVVQRLESETSCNSSESTRRYRMEIERLRAETADEVKQLRDQHSLALDRLVTAQNEQRAGEEFKRDLEKRLLQAQYESAAKDHLIREQKNELSRLKVDEETLVQCIRGDYAAQLDAKETALHAGNETIARHARELEEMQARHRIEIDQLVEEKERTVHLIEESVRKALGSKDQLLASLKSEAEEMSMRNQHLERLLEQQRQELLS
ncbi:Centrosomal protein of 131 kDa [Geranomyces michiganensis]|nr:Centrosomal protein of 131 kDa [Geranomyces michiganensis]